MNTARAGQAALILSSGLPGTEKPRIAATKNDTSVEGGSQRATADLAPTRTLPRSAGSGFSQSRLSQVTGPAVRHALRLPNSSVPSSQRATGLIAMVHHASTRAANPIFSPSGQEPIEILILRSSARAARDMHRLGFFMIRSWAMFMTVILLAGCQTPYA